MEAKGREIDLCYGYFSSVTKPVLPSAQRKASEKLAVSERGFLR